MTDPHHTLDRGITKARRVLNRSRLIDSACRAMVAAGVGALIAAIVFIATGRAVPTLVYGATLLFAVSAGALLWWSRRLTRDDAAREIDRRFDLADGVTSAMHFREMDRSDGMHGPQAAWAARMLSRVDLEVLRTRPGRKLMLAAALPLTLAVTLGFVPESAARTAERIENAERLSLSQDLNDFMKEEVEREIEEASEEELEALDPEAIRELVAELELTSDQEQLLRQYAKMEQALAEKSASLDQADADRLLADLEAGLRDSPENAALKKALAEQRLQEASAALGAFKQSASDGVSAESLAKQQQELEKLQRLASDLAEGARRFSSDASNTGTDADRLAQQAERLQREAEELSESLSQCKNGNCQNSSDNQRAQRAAGQCNSTLSEMQRSLNRMWGKKQACSSMDSLRQSLAQCQACAAGLGSKPSSSKKAGVGSVDSTSNEIAASHGQQSDLQGIKGAGPSETEVLDASSGEGVTMRRAAAVNNDYAREAESFVERANVPEALKDGVREYLERIHRDPADVVNPEDPS